MAMKENLITSLVPKLLPLPNRSRFSPTPSASRSNTFPSATMPHVPVCKRLAFRPNSSTHSFHLPHSFVAAKPPRSFPPSGKSPAAPHSHFPTGRAKTPPHSIEQAGLPTLLNRKSRLNSTFLLEIRPV